MQLRTCRTLDGLIAILRERRDELDLTNEVLEAVSGISDGYAAKVLSLTPTRRLGPMSLNAILGALALKICTITIEDDEVAAAVVAPRWKRRRGRPRKQRTRKAKAKPRAKAKPKSAAAPYRCVVEQRQTAFNFDNTGEADMADKMIGVRVDDDLDERVRAAAAKERRPVSQFVRNVLSDAVRPQPGEAVSKPEVAA